MAVVVLPHDARWKTAFDDEARAIRLALGNTTLRLHHIGSTAIPGIVAKPIVDLLGVVSSLADADAKAPTLENIGYEVMGAYGVGGRRYFRKVGKTGTRTHHLHVFEEGSPQVERHLAFRDYLIAHPRVAREYSALKERLTLGNSTDRASYADGKAPFIATVEPQAVEWFRKLKR